MELRLWLARAVLTWVMTCWAVSGKLMSVAEAFSRAVTPDRSRFWAAPSSVLPGWCVRLGEIACSSVSLPRLLLKPEGMVKTLPTVSVLVRAVPACVVFSVVVPHADVWFFQKPGDR